MSEVTAREVSKAGKMFLGAKTKSRPILTVKGKIGTKLTWSERLSSDYDDCVDFDPLSVQAFKDWLTERGLILEETEQEKEGPFGMIWRVCSVKVLD